ncbi:hypothetical protein BDK51DRAFT_52194 [Blyttiomyces helicus]|uniref:Armadillo-type protein n=1 Tax=Blyttiomyces helicus TaxID=388810 RepID=A0A4P9WM46_9FUNG|nr:hypothetical protein BDK51DRAFT_52194 [Blyttiomyces helicus]|eukprot:RKO92738.1 hypothetical protein BDK51DRAFT_52194 [Blyttiomyces helicus]
MAYRNPSPPTSPPSPDSPLLSPAAIITSLLSRISLTPSPTLTHILTLIWDATTDPAYATAVNSTGVAVLAQVVTSPLSSDRDRECALGALGNLACGGDHAVMGCVVVVAADALGASADPPVLREACRVVRGACARVRMGAEEEEVRSMIAAGGAVERIGFVIENALDGELVCAAASAFGELVRVGWVVEGEAARGVARACVGSLRVGAWRTISVVELAAVLDLLHILERAFGVASLLGSRALLAHTTRDLLELGGTLHADATGDEDDPRVEAAYSALMLVDPSFLPALQPVPAAPIGAVAELLLPSMKGWKLLHALLRAAGPGVGEVVKEIVARFEREGVEVEGVGEELEAEDGVVDATLLLMNSIVDGGKD